MDKPLGEKRPSWLTALQGWRCVPQKWLVLLLVVLATVGVTVLVMSRYDRWLHHKNWVAKYPEVRPPKGTTRIRYGFWENFLSIPRRINDAPIVDISEWERREDRRFTFEWFTCKLQQGTPFEQAWAELGSELLRSGWTKQDVWRKQGQFADSIPEETKKFLGRDHFRFAYYYREKPPEHGFLKIYVMASKENGQLYIRVVGHRVRMPDHPVWH